MVDRGGELVDTLRIEGGEFANPHDRYSNSSGRVSASRQKINAAVMVARSMGSRSMRTFAMSAWAILL
uniref:Uncharacterized protein n=1 Tax=Rhizobium leguminosarum TaxID=384 RepID=A0A179BXR0_RHILE|nr:hypothetical protein A4U53_38245 [Rhizobium leguminosarum]